MQQLIHILTALACGALGGAAAALVLVLALRRALIDAQAALGRFNSLSDRPTRPEPGGQAGHWSDAGVIFGTPIQPAGDDLAGVGELVRWREQRAAGAGSVPSQLDDEKMGLREAANDAIWHGGCLLCERFRRAGRAAWAGLRGRVAAATRASRVNRATETAVRER